MSSFKSLFLAFLFASVATPLTMSAAIAANLCATSDQSKQVQEYYAANPGRLPFMVTKALNLVEAQVLSGMPKDQALGVTNASFQQVWSSLTEWETAVTLIIGGGHTLEVYGPVHKGEPSTKSKNFNLNAEGPGMSGHLRPDLVSAIYAVSVTGKDGARTRGVLFMDAEGKSTFGVFIPSEETAPSAAQVAQFEKTWKIFSDAPKACG